MKKIVVDCYGGDNAPEEIVKGALDALDAEKNLSLILTGNSDVLEKLVTRHSDRVEIIDAKEVITNDDSPTDAIRKKTESSMVKAFDALKERDDVGGFVSAGSTGAILTGAFMKLGRIKGISRPAMAALLPTSNGNENVVLCDCGANVDCKPVNLLHFALMADAYARITTGKNDVKVALLSNGTEDKKGSELNREAFALLKESTLNFVGNMEARDILSGKYDVVVADGFNGNIALKSLEGAGLTIFDMLKKNVSEGGLRAKFGALLLKPALKKLKHTMDVNEKGGAVFLGTNKVVIKIHGSSKARSVTVGILQASTLAERDVVNAIRTALAVYEVKNDD
ncbi:MAG: phosphate acyltransferase PlsX [Eubacteriales bacterium]|nr:phosphate acyltransferase PlsX [Eubacteriales bacterium]